MKTPLHRNDLLKFAETSRSEFEETLRDFVEIPTISSDPSRKADMDRGIDLAVEAIRKSGGVPQVVQTGGVPLVHGRFGNSKHLPTITVYNHLDVQPASRETEPWNTDPFTFTRKGESYYGRGTTDDKGPALSALFGIRAAREADVPANLAVLWEFEEEIGSPNFERGITSAKKKLATDSVVVSDTIWVSRKRPACPAGLRGLQGFTLSLETGETDQHSGVAGGAARNPIGELMQLVSEMYDARTGRVKIPGFYDDVQKPTGKELKEFKASGFSVSGFKKDHQFRSIRTNDALEVMKRIWSMPTMEVHGLVGGYTGPGIKTIIPGRAEVKISFRLVPDQTPGKVKKLVGDFVKKRSPDVRLTAEAGMFPFKAPIDGPLPDAVRAAMKFAFGKTPVFVREGGSIGAVTSIERVLDCPVVFLGLSLPEHGYHAPNENFDWPQARGGMVAFAKYFECVARL